MSDFWDTDKPTTVDEAMQLLRFGAVQYRADEDTGPAIARTERRMANSAKYLEDEIGRLEAQRDAAVEALKELRDIVQGMIDENAHPKDLIDSFTLQPARAVLAEIGDKG